MIDDIKKRALHRTKIIEGLDALAERALVVDGGLGTRLEERGAEVSSELWSARVLADSPDEVLDVHRDYFALAAAVDEVVAVGVNCCAPAEVLGAIEAAREVTTKLVVVYPNSGETWDAAARRWRGRAAFPPEAVRSWQAAGARLIGGCCRTGPGQITAIGRALA